MEPTYLLWTPRIADGEVRVNVTPGSVDRWPKGSPEFYGQLLADLGLAGETPESWTVLPYRTSYHGPDHPTGNPRVDWKKNWLVRVRTKKPPEPRVFPGVLDTEAFDSGPEERESGGMACMVIADFATSQKADAAKGTLLEEFGEEIARDDIETVEVGGAPFWQLQINVGRFPESFFAEDAPRARRIEGRCRELGGWPTFEERVIGQAPPPRRKKKK